MDILLGFLILSVGVSTKIILRRRALRTLSEEIRPSVAAIMNTHFRFDFCNLKWTDFYLTFLVSALLIGAWWSGPSACSVQGALLTLVTMLLFCVIGGLHYLQLTRLLRMGGIQGISSFTNIFILTTIFGVLCDCVALLFQFSC